MLRGLADECFASHDTIVRLPLAVYCLLWLLLIVAISLIFELSTSHLYYYLYENKLLILKLSINLLAY